MFDVNKFELEHDFVDVLFHMKGLFTLSVISRDFDYIPVSIREKNQFGLNFNVTSRKHHILFILTSIASVDI